MTIILNFQATEIIEECSALFNAAKWKLPGFACEKKYKIKTWKQHSESPETLWQVLQEAQYNLSANFLIKLHKLHPRHNKCWLLG